LPRESKQRKRERALEILRRLEEMYPESRCSLDHESPFQLVLATVLSAQCTDALVNRVTPELFRRYRSPSALAEAPLEEIEDVIRPVNYYRTKARALKGIGETLVSRFGGEVPRTMEGLTVLPGVGRKTANVILGVGFGKADGIVVDTHVKRVARRLALTRSEDAVEVEHDLLPLIPRELRVVFTHRVIDHGRAVCVARRPRCEKCLLTDICPSSLVVAPTPAST
jgi:endonuclease III